MFQTYNVIVSNLYGSNKGEFIMITLLVDNGHLIYIRFELGR